MFVAEHSDVCILMIDGAEDLKLKTKEYFILQIEIKCVILVNKWDLIKKDTNSTKNFEEQIKRQISPFGDIPIMFVSVHWKTKTLKNWAL